MSLRKSGVGFGADRVATEGDATIVARDRITHWEIKGGVGERPSPAAAHTESLAKESNPVHSRLHGVVT